MQTPTIAFSGLSNELFLPESSYQLPASYRQFIPETGTFPANYACKTDEPTSDSLDHVFIHYFAGWQKFIPADKSLPEYLVPFSQNETQYFCFDYQQSKTRPSIRYVDTDVDQWLFLAKDFTTFYQNLMPYPISVDPESFFLPLVRNHYFLIAQPTELTALFNLYESVTDKSWYCQWLLYYADNGSLQQQTAALAAYHVQRQYFSHKLPLQQTQALDASFSNNSNLKETYLMYQADWTHS